jgi:hypothetical protein
MQTINRTTKNWLKVESKEIVHEEFPSYESIIINHRNQQLLASPMKNVSLSDETKNFEKFIEENNYSNTYLKIIGTKLDNIENKIDPIKPTAKLDIEKLLFTPHEIPRVSFKKDNTDLLEEISKRLQTLDITNIVSSSQTKEQTNQFKIINTIDKIKQDKPKLEEYIENLQDQFKDLNINNTDLLQEISKRLQTLDITNIASSSQTKEQTNQFKRINTIDKIKQDKPKLEEYIENLQDQFKDLNINRISNERDFHTKSFKKPYCKNKIPWKCFNYKKFLS